MGILNYKNKLSFNAFAKLVTLRSEKILKNNAISAKY